MTTNLPPPSFCYILTVQSGEVHVEVDEEEQISNLYQPPAVRGLKEILQVVCFKSPITNAFYHCISSCLIPCFCTIIFRSMVVMSVVAFGHECYT